ncbi:hypothetical protein FRB97_007815 [Tulasnella sp. 331]|nr:hypothetical protein FRB97_007815 [Tulasnella sp. 331]
MTPKKTLSSLDRSIARNTLSSKQQTTSSVSQSQGALQNGEQVAPGGRTLSYSEAARKSSTRKDEFNEPTHDKNRKSPIDREDWTPFTSLEAPRPRRQASSHGLPQPSKTDDVFTSAKNSRISRSFSEIVDSANQGRVRRIVSVEISPGYSDSSSLRVPHSTISLAPVSNLDFVNDLMDDGVGGAISRSTSVTTFGGGTLSTFPSNRSFTNFGGSRTVSRTSTLLTEMYSDHDITPTAAHTSEPNFEDFQAGLTPQKGLSGSASSPVNSLRRSTHEKRVVALQGYAAAPSPQAKMLAASRKDQRGDSSMDDAAIIAAYLDSELDEAYHSHNTSFEVEEPSFYASAETSFVLPSTDTSFHGVVTGIEGFGGVLGDMELLEESESEESSGLSMAECTDEEDKENQPATRRHLPSLFETTFRSLSNRFGDALPPSAVSTTSELSLPHDRTPLSLLHASGDDRSNIWNTRQESSSMDRESSSSDQVADTDNLDAQYLQALASKYVPHNSWSPELNEADMERLQLYGSSVSSSEDPRSAPSEGGGFVMMGENGPTIDRPSPVLALKASPGVIGSHLRRSRDVGGSPHKQQQLEGAHGLPTPTIGSVFSLFDSATSGPARGLSVAVGLGIHVSEIDSPVIPPRLPHAPVTNVFSLSADSHTHFGADRYDYAQKISHKWEANCLNDLQPGATAKDLDGSKKHQDETDETLQDVAIPPSTISSLPGHHSRSARRVSQEPSSRLPVILEVLSPSVSMHTSVHGQSAGCLLEEGDPFWPHAAPIRRSHSLDLSIVKPCGLFLPLPFSDPVNPNFIPDWWYGPTGQRRAGFETPLSLAMSEMWEQIPNVIAPIDRSFGLLSSWDLESADDYDATPAKFTHSRPTASQRRFNPMNDRSSTKMAPAERFQNRQTVQNAEEALPSNHSSAIAQSFSMDMGAPSQSLGGLPAGWNGHVPQYAIYATDTPSVTYATNPVAAYPGIVLGNSRPSSTTLAPPTAPRAMLYHTRPQPISAPPPPYSMHQSTMPSSSLLPTGILGSHRSASTLPHLNFHATQPVPLQQRQVNHAHASLARAPTPAAFSNQHQHQQHQSQQQQQQQQQHLYPGPRFPAGMVHQHQPHAKPQRGGKAAQPPRPR